MRSDHVLYTFTDLRKLEEGAKNTYLRMSTLCAFQRTNSVLK